MIPFDYYHIKCTFITPPLGATPKDLTIFEEHVANEAPPEALKEQLRGDRDLLRRVKWGVVETAYRAGLI